MLSVAKSAASVLWNHFVSEPELSEENTNIQTASSDLCISLQRFVNLLLFFPFCFPFYEIFNNWFMLSVRISSYGCTREVWRAREKRKSYSRRSQEQL